MPDQARPEQPAGQPPAKPERIDGTVNGVATMTDSLVRLAPRRPLRAPEQYVTETRRGGEQ